MAESESEAEQREAVRALLEAVAVYRHRVVALLEAAGPSPAAAEQSPQVRAARLQAAGAELDRRVEALAEDYLVPRADCVAVSAASGGSRADQLAATRRRASAAALALERGLVAREPRVAHAVPWRRRRDEAGRPPPATLGEAVRRVRALRAGAEASEVPGGLALRVGLAFRALVAADLSLVNVLGLDEAEAKGGGGEDADPWRPSARGVFVRLSAHATCAAAHFAVGAPSVEAALVELCDWLGSHADLFSAPCRGCGALLLFDSSRFGLLPPVARTFHGRVPYHAQCVPASSSEAV